MSGTAGTHLEKNGGKRPRWGMVIDLDRCTACGACAVACAQENNVPFGSPTDSPETRMIRWMEILHAAPEENHAATVRMIPMPCQHCDHPPCTKVCPVYATYRNPEGLVPQVYYRCIGCRYCVNACPYTCKHFNWREPEWPEALVLGLNPDVSIRHKGVTEKCNFCLHRLQKARDDAAAEGRPLRDGDYRTACQQACPAKAIAFGDLDDPTTRVARAAESPRTTRLLEDLGTEPKVFYLREGA